MSKLHARMEAVRVKLSKAKLLNEGLDALTETWNMLDYLQEKRWPGMVRRDVKFVEEDDFVVVTAYLAEVK